MSRVFSSIITDCVIPKSVEWVSPTSMQLDINDGNGMKTYVLAKGALEYLHSQVDIKVATSKDLFKKSETMWKQLKDDQLVLARNRVMKADVFDLEASTTLYLIDSQAFVIVDIVTFADETSCEEFKKKHQNFKLELTSNRNSITTYSESEGGLVKFINYNTTVDIEEDKYIPIVILEGNNNKAQYKAFNGIMMISGTVGGDDFAVVIMPALSANLDEKRLSTLIEYFDMDSSLKFAVEKAPDMYKAYQEFCKNPIEISAREMTSLCKSLGYKLQLDDGDTLHPIEALNDETNNLVIQAFYNTFKDVTGESTYEILKMSDLKRTFRYNKVTLLDMLTILSKEYYVYYKSKVTAEVLSDIVYKLYYTHSLDRLQSEDVKNDMK